MGTFHDDRGELHGITVVVDTDGPMVFVGRCDTMDKSAIILLDVDEHQDGHEGRTKRQYLERAKQFGTWKKYSRLQIPMDEVRSVQPLGKWTPDEPTTNRALRDHVSSPV